MNRTKYPILGLAIATLLAQVVGLRALARSGALGSGDAEFHNAIYFSLATSVLALIAVVASVVGIARESGKPEWIASCVIGVLALGHFAFWLAYGL